MISDENLDDPEPSDDDIEAVRQQDEARLPAGYHPGGSDITSGVPGGGLAGVKKSSNPDDRFDE
jgi:hypothetical protein